MSPRRAAAALAAALAVLTGCGGAPRAEGTATLWVTRDEGRKVLLVADVPAGLTALQALDREADVETRYGGRYVNAINGVAGSLSAGRDWFYFVNGYEGDRGAAEYRLRDGDVEWWDFRSWRTRQRQPFVVGAFPEPFAHGFDGRRREAAVRYEAPEHADVARALGDVVGATSVAEASEAAPPGANVLVVVGRPGNVFREDPQARAERPGDAVRLLVGAGAARRLAREPAVFRFRYEVAG